MKAIHLWAILLAKCILKQYNVEMCNLDGIHFNLIKSYTYNKTSRNASDVFRYSQFVPISLAS